MNETLTAIADGGTQHRANGADPYPGVVVAEENWEETAGTAGFFYHYPKCSRVGCASDSVTTDKKGYPICAGHYYTEAPGDDVPFALPPDPVEGEPGDTPFGIAERIVMRWGVTMANEIAQHIQRWGERRNG